MASRARGSYNSSDLFLREKKQAT